MKGSGNSINFRYRVHDPRLGRFLSIDPSARDYPWNSPYAFSENRLLDMIELEGLETYPVHPSYGLNNIAEGFRQYFQAAGKQVDKAYISISGTFSQTLHKFKTTIGIAEVETKTTASNTTTATAKTNLEQFFTTTSQNKPAGPPYLLTVENKTEISQTTELQAKIRYVDVKVEYSNTGNVTNGTAESSVEVTVGKDDNGVFVSKSKSSDGSSQTDVGVKAGDTYKFSGERSFSWTFKAGTTIEKTDGP